MKPEGLVPGFIDSFFLNHACAQASEVVSTPFFLHVGQQMIATTAHGGFSKDG